VTFDLTGLPPSPEQVDAFVADQSSEAFATVVDRLLASPQFGERWARHWLDVARYTNELNGPVNPDKQLNSFRYRDWVVNAFNADMPYDMFLRLQLAGDLLAEPQDDAVTRLAGLGFQGLGLKLGNPAGMEKKVIADELDDRVDTLTRGLLGLTVSCARCHDHALRRARAQRLEREPGGDDESAAAALRPQQRLHGGDVEGLCGAARQRGGRRRRPHRPGLEAGLRPQSTTSRRR
jgi:hypothetical protein